MGNDKKSPDEQSFEERLRQAQVKVQTDTSFEAAGDKPASPMGIAFKMGVELVVGSGLGAFIGFWFDKWSGMAPLFMVTLLVLGFAGGIRNIFRDAEHMNAVSSETKSGDDVKDDELNTD